MAAPRTTAQLQPSTDPKARSGRRSPVLGSVRKALSVLQAFSFEAPELGVSELARRLGWSKSSVHLLLSTLQSEGFVEQNPERGRYRLGIKAFEVGSVALSHLGLGPHVLPLMEQLGRTTGETITLGILAGTDALFVQRVESAEVLRVDLRVGTRVPLHASAMGKLLLASFDSEQRSAVLDQLALSAATPKTIVDRSALEAELVIVARQGYAISHEEIFPGIIALAAPVRDYTGRVVAALSVAGPVARLDPDSCRQPLVETAQALSRLLGDPAHR